jgi:hypothetical protein
MDPKKLVAEYDIAEVRLNAPLGVISETCFRTSDKRHVELTLLGATGVLLAFNDSELHLAPMHNVRSIKFVKKVQE